MKTGKFVLALFFISTIVVSGCLGKETTLDQTVREDINRDSVINPENKDDKLVESAKIACINACNMHANNLKNLDDGPCLANNIFGIDDWVCDIAHSPRLPVDDLPENQCSAYREGVAHHFVEVDTNCNFIRAA